jgi:hypothetical protein
MNKLRIAAAVLLALPLLVFGGNHFLELFQMPAFGPSAGTRLLQSMRDGGLMMPIAASHVIIGLMLLLPHTRFLGALLQLPISLGIVAFHVTMLPEGNIMAFVMLGLNLLVLTEAGRFRSLLHRPAVRKS